MHIFTVNREIEFEQSRFQAIEREREGKKEREKERERKRERERVYG